MRGCCTDHPGALIAVTLASDNRERCRSMAAVEQLQKFFQPHAEAEAGLNFTMCGNQMPKHVRYPSKIEYLYRFSVYRAIAEQA